MLHTIEPQYYLKTSDIDKEFISLFNKPGPYYSSYPILGKWKDLDTNSLYLGAMKDFFISSPDRPLHLYLHIPYCAKLCYYCSCRLHISNNRKIINNFVMHLIKEIKMLANFFHKNDIKPNFKEVHFGGGTPSHLTIEEIKELIINLQKFVNFKDLKEFSMEIDPRTVNFKDFDQYAKFGVDRISFGVQDFDPTVQLKINRVQPFKLVEKLMKEEIQQKFKGVNFDLLYGLPSQTIETFRKTIELTKTLSPERITLIKYAHIPKKRKHLNMINIEDLPHEKLLPEMFVESTESLINDGYDWVGIDHFAKKNDTLAIAKQNGNVYRNFGGETPGFTKDIISLGPSSTSAFGNYYFQATYDLNNYRASTSNNEFPISKFHILNNDDLIRRFCNFELQCNQKLDIKKVERSYNINFNKYFKNELLQLKYFQKKNFLTLDKNNIIITTKGRYFIRHICQVFDIYFDKESIYEVHGN